MPGQNKVPYLESQAIPYLDPCPSIKCDKAITHHDCHTLKLSDSPLTTWQDIKKILEVPTVQDTDAYTAGTSRDLGRTPMVVILWFHTH
jgi:hypothetical protein